MPRDIFTVPEIMAKLCVISDREESRYSDVPGWQGEVMSWTEAAVLFRFLDNSEEWLPYSHLRKAEDGRSIYASLWILEQKGL